MFHCSFFFLYWKQSIVLLNICESRKYENSWIYIDLLSSERWEKLSLNEVVLSFNHLGGRYNFSALDKMCVWSLKRASLIGVIVSLQDKTNRNKFIIFWDVVWLIMLKVFSLDFFFNDKTFRKVILEFCGISVYLKEL